MNKPLRILHLEDDPRDAELVYETLVAAGFAPETVVVQTKAEYLAQLDQDWDIILADYALPQFDGLQALALFKERGLDIAFVIISGTIGEDNAVAAMRAGASDYVMKDKLARLGPVVTRELQETTERRERKRAEDRLRESELQYRTLANSGQALIWTSGLDKACDYFNEIWLQFTGRALEQELGNGWTEGVHPDDMAKCLQTYVTAFDKREAFSMEYRLRHASGEYRWLQDNGTPRFDSTGNFLGYIGHCLDITASKRAEEERDSLQTQLAQVQKMETVGQLAAGVAHDFNNLLMGIIGFTQFAYDAAPEGSTSREDTAEVLTLAKRASDLTRQLLAFSRRQTLISVVCDLNQLMSDLLKMLGRLIGEHITISFVPGAGLGAVKADPGQIEQVIVNLAVNARDVMPDGGLLTLETHNVELDDAYAADHIGTIPGSYVLLTITDTGCGMEASVLEHIFEPFYTTKDIGKGTGLGLSTVYGIIKQHGGNIWVGSEVGQGTSFKVYLPRVAEEAIAVQVDGPTASLAGTETILIVEDDAFVRNVSERILASHGYRVLKAALPSEAEALLAAEGDAIALLLTDIMMPERNGYQLYQSVHARFPRLRVLYMSGYADDAIIQQGITDMGTTFIQKPFTADALARKVREALG